MKGHIVIDFSAVRRPLLAIGLDSFDAFEVDARLKEGQLPNLAQLLGEQSYQRLEPDTPGLGGMAWVNFVNNVPTSDHGWYFIKVWSPEHGRTLDANGSWLRQSVFWQPLEQAGLRIGLIDVPYAKDPGPNFKGAYLNGWQNHDVERLRSHPRSLVAELEERFGKPVLKPERYGPQSPSDLLEMRQNTLSSIEQVTRLTEWLLKRDRYDLFIMVFGAIHRAGHYLWDLSQIDRDGLSAEECRKLENAMDDIYAACDAALGRIVAAAPDMDVMAFAVHGMRANPGWNDVLPELLGGLDRSAEQAPERSLVRDYLHSLRRSSFALKASRNLPPIVNRTISRVWAAKAHDWSKPRHFIVPSEVVGAIRLNVTGREPQGILSRADAASYAEELAAKIRALRDLETGEPIAQDVFLTDNLISEEAPFRHVLPDILVDWADHQLIDSLGVKTPGGAELRWPRGRRVTSGRSGDHRHHGWVLGDVPVRGRGNAAPAVLDLSRTMLAHGQIEPAQTVA